MEYLFPLFQDDLALFKRRGGHGGADISDLLPIDGHTALLDQAARLALGGSEACLLYTSRCV